MASPIVETSAAPAAAAAQKTILICDDDPDILGFLSILLTSEGYNVLESPCADEVPKLLASAKPDLVLLDIRMPDHDGFWVAESLKIKGCRLPIIFMTAYDSSMYRMYGAVVGSADYITKPVDKDLLLKKIDRALKTNASQTDWFAPAIVM